MTRPSLLAIWWALLCSPLTGCGGDDPRLRPTDADPGRDAAADTSPTVPLDAGLPDLPLLDAEAADLPLLDAEPPDQGPPAECPDDMVAVPAGDFPFGPQDMPRYVPDYCIDIAEVSAGAYLDCVDAGACDGYDGWALCAEIEPRSPHQCRDDRLDHPANWIDWFRAEQYCRWAGKRLPGAAEWEKAARGPAGLLYPWGDRPGCADAHVERGDPFDACLGFDGLPDAPLPVDAYADVPSPYGALNLIGNVREWVDVRVDRAVLPADDEMGITKGGDWRSSFDQAAADARDGTLSVSRSSRGHGVRCALDLPPAP